MPLPSKPKIEQEGSNHVVVHVEGRWRCPECGGIHHFASRDGCHARCGYKGPLYKVTREIPVKKIKT